MSGCQGAGGMNKAASGAASIATPPSSPSGISVGSVRKYSLRIVPENRLRSAMPGLASSC
jgi:hypothetical protein